MSAAASPLRETRLGTTKSSFTIAHSRGESLVIAKVRITLPGLVGLWMLLQNVKCNLYHVVIQENTSESRFLLRDLSQQKFLLRDYSEFF